MQALKPFTPTMVGGSADLVESTKTEFVGGGLFSATHAGRNIAFGIREHAMGSIVNGISLHGGMLKPYGATFFVFSDYMRPAVRLSALGHYPVIWVWTHDSIGVGEDGPTHQPVEHLMSLRAMPNLWVVRPVRRERDRGRLEGRDRARGRAGRARALAPEAADARPERGRARRGARAGRLHALGERLRPT